MNRYYRALRPKSPELREHGLPGWWGATSNKVAPYPTSPLVCVCLCDPSVLCDPAMSSASMIEPYASKLESLQSAISKPCLLVTIKDCFSPEVEALNDELTEPDISADAQKVEGEGESPLRDPLLDCFVCFRREVGVA